MSTPVKKVPIHLQSAQNRLLIKHGKVVNEDDITEDDIYIEDGVIKQLGRNLIIPGGTRVIDARGKYVLPGGIDPHTHFEMEFMGAKSVDDFYQGTKAAVAGGTTMIIDFVMPKKGESILDAFYEYRQKGDDKVCCDYGLHVALTHWNEQVRREMEVLCKEHGVNSFKVFMAYGFMLNDSELYSVFETCQKLGAVAQVHAENGAIIAKNVERLLAKGITGPEGHEMSRPEEVEAEAVNRACVIAKQVNAPIYILNVTTEESGNIIRTARSKGQTVFGEVRAGSIGLIGDPRNANMITAPAIRSRPETPFQLLGLLASDVLQVTGSDNCTFNKSQKEMGKNDFSKIPNGVNGVEDRMSVIWEKGVQSGMIDPCRFVAITSTNAAKIFNIYPRKGCIAVGSDADLVIWDPTKTRTISASTHHQAVDFNIFEGMVCHGVPEFVIVNGRVCVDDGQLRVVQGHGHFVETPVYAPFVYDPEKIADLKPVRNGTHDDNLSEHVHKVTIEDKACPTPTLPDSAVSTPSVRGPRPEGQRNIQDSTFSISEDLDVDRKSCIRVRNPPGGKSSGFW
ncbi:Dihydropyrimidinase-like Protein [Tribolium castaneum]|uniref:dihydropyrimidinase n=2 Tax=Tribolium castaneum TaxID=7070 RepID=D6W7R7_TRICA|nr:PREDICTED: dihydropyrimidinase isoform X2 [Tribolium castaneum]EFA11336.2 Dihydropyrimidinase-like Protein [Tribolium castaneum]|eukprot:XP_015835842.1 PREDICTED: dihydropyrimidinase isoform X2 [Tribolium castaneum]